jgi:predicted AAA+ superfamily ATPase
LHIVLSKLINMIERAELQLLTNRIIEPRKYIQVVMGPRQVGKTTLIHQLLSKVNIPSSYQSADAISIGGSVWLEQIVETCRLKMQIQSLSDYILVIDEIQKIPNWSETIKKLWDEDTANNTSLKIILLGSSRLLLQLGLTESLAGRFETMYMTHWSFREMQMAFGWDEKKYAWFGGYPGSAELISDEKRWKAYIRDSLIETSISKDILMLTRIDKPALIKMLFEFACVYSGQIVSYTKMQGQLHDAGNTTTLAHYLKLLETAGLVTGLEKYAHTFIRKRSSSPKLQVCNNALLSSQHAEMFEEILIQPEKWGRIVESAIGSHLVNNSVQNNYSVYYWRDGNDEVDFVLEKNNKTIAIEVKSSFVKNKIGMEAFKKKFNPSKVLIIDNYTLPWFEFLTIQPSELF